MINWFDIFMFIWCPIMGAILGKLQNEDPVSMINHHKTDNQHESTGV